MSAFDDPRYYTLAQRAATILGTTSPEIINAILAQWTCELGAWDTYPPARNNPGNLSEDAAKAIGFPYTVPDLSTNPQPGNPIVTFDTPERGADAYGILLNTLPRYQGVRDAVKSGDHHAYFKAIENSGYGGGAACMESAYRDPVEGTPASLGLKPAGAVWWVETVRLARLFAADANGILRPVPAPNPSAFTFLAWTGANVTKVWAPGPKSTQRNNAIFRKSLGPPHRGQYIRLSDQGCTWHEIKG